MERKIRSQHDEVMLLPFSGLGTTLSCANAHAALCKLTPIPTGKKSDSVRPLLPTAFISVSNGYGSGFGMLIALGRETRGR
ncbi:hypothetical protein [Halodesulfovibrio aestuarii]|uniref:hypothetical protein n=1 Tax=Halodesulfovibrio aestuarii TaxID=126333 RepID=UPI003D338DF7